MTRPTLASSCRLLFFFFMAKRRRANSQDHSEVSLLFFFPGMGRESPPPTQQMKTTWEQVLGMLLTGGSSTDRGKHTLSCPLYPSNRIICIFQPVTAGAAQAYIPVSFSKAISKRATHRGTPKWQCTTSIRQDYTLAVNWETSMGRQICAAQQYVLSHTLQVKTQLSLHSWWIWIFTKRKRWKKCGRKRNTKGILKKMQLRSYFFNSLQKHWQNAQCITTGH